jgi:hypothetical protein
MLSMGIAVIALLAGPAPPEPLKPGSILPEVTGETLAGQTATLPAAVQGQTALIVFTFSREAGADAQKWVERFLRDFGSRPGVSSFSVMMLQSVPGLLRGIVSSQIKKGMPAALHDRVLRVYRDEEVWRKRLSASSEGQAYLVLLDPEGRIRWLSRAHFSETTYERLVQEVGRLGVED